MNWEVWISFAFIAGAATITPGPGNLNTLRRAIELGHRAAFFSLLGNVAGLAALGTATGLGLLALLIASPVLWTAFRWIAIGFLVFLSLQMIATSSKPQSTLRQVKRGTHLHLFFEAAGVSFLNPKAAIFFAAVFPLYTDPLRPILPQVMVVIMTCLVVSAMSHGMYILMASLTRHHVGSQRGYRVFRVVSGLVMLGLAAWLFTQTVQR